MPSKEPEIDPSSLLDFLRLVGGELSRKIVLVAAGGTALTLLGVKPSTRDIDFTGPGEDIEAFKRALGGIPHGMKVDTWPGGQVFTQFLPSDYLARSKPIKQLTNIDLRALHPVDIIVTKIGRLDERDEQDIEACIREFKISKSAVAKRAKRVAYVGNEELFRSNVEYALRRFFGSK